MATIYSFLKNVWQDIRQETVNNFLFLPFLLVLITIPMRYAYNSIATGVFIGISLFTLRKHNLKYTKELLLPIVLYALMAVSLLWSINVPETQKALFKIFPLVLMPLCFMISPQFSCVQKRKILDYYGYAFVLFAVFYLLRAAFKYVVTHDSSVFFYHELVTNDVNAIHVSVYMVVAYFAILTKSIRKAVDIIGLFLITVLVFLLSSKNVIVVFLLLNVGYFLSAGSFRNKKRLFFYGLGFAIFMSVVFFDKVKNRFEIEIESNLNANSVNESNKVSNGIVYNVTANEAWHSEKFQKNNFFPGAALRIYQIRIFLEMMQTDKAYLTGYGLNATDSKIKEKRIEHNLYEGYDQFNFHNQYIQFFAEVGIAGFLLVLWMVFYNLKNAVRSKDFTHISFAILMISLFLTESFLSRQRGIIFFIALYCFFNAVKTIPSKTEKE